MGIVLLFNLNAMSFFSKSANFSAARARMDLPDPVMLGAFSNNLGSNRSNTSSNNRMFLDNLSHPDLDEMVESICLTSKSSEVHEIVSFSRWCFKLRHVSYTFFSSARTVRNVLMYAAHAWYMSMARFNNSAPCFCSNKLYCRTSSLLDSRIAPHANTRDR